LPKSSRDIDPNVLESVLKGKTLQVYWYIIQQPSHTVGIRQVQRALVFSSPSIAVHHLEKLNDLGLVEKKGTGEYVLLEEVKVGVLKLFTHMGRFLVPRYLFYSVLFSTMFAAYLMLCTMTQITPSFYAITFSAVAMLIFWVETVRLWRERPF
jgi:DNA-binding transcriptional ArsR family regulator